jgi:hypothetical protein
VYFAILIVMKGRSLIKWELVADCVCEAFLLICWLIRRISLFFFGVCRMQSEYLQRLTDEDYPAILGVNRTLFSEIYAKYCKGTTINKP